MFFSGTGDGADTTMPFSEALLLRQPGPGERMS